MNKALCISAAVAFALSSTAFAGGNKHSKSSARADTSASAQIAASDCDQLSVASAKAACLRHAQANAGAQSSTAIGASDSAPAAGLAAGGADPASPTGSKGKKDD